MGNVLTLIDFDSLVYSNGGNKMVNFQKIIYWLFVIFVIYIAFEIIRKMLGGSLGFEELVITLLVANLGLSYRTHSRLCAHLGWHKGKDKQP